MVASQKDYIFGVIDFDWKQQDHALNAKNPSVDVISQEEVVDVLGSARFVKHMA